MVTNKYFPKLQPKLRTCSRSVQEIHLGHLAGLDAARDVDVGLHRLVVGVAGNTAEDEDVTHREKWEALFQVIRAFVASQLLSGKYRFATEKWLECFRANEYLEF